MWLDTAVIILAHNHPSLNSEPSNTDKVLTQRLKDTLALVGYARRVTTLLPAEKLRSLLNIDPTRVMWTQL
ncbi:JAB domain-containing protein [Lonsdalea quercina]|uniref:JAB domain-containing protein n=1 Tax=Lonsdalea quercina TaxID=71657 RepID=UPI0039767217